MHLFISITGKGQALVQMQDQIGATALVDFYNVNPAMLRFFFLYFLSISFLSPFFLLYAFVLSL